MAEPNGDVVLLDSPPDWWDEQIASHGGLLTSSTIWADLMQQMGIGRGRFLVANLNGRPALAMLICDTLVGGLWLSGEVPRFLLQTASRLPFVRVLWASLQPIVLDPVLIEDQERLLTVSVLVFRFLAQCAAQERLGGIFPLSYVPFRSLSYACQLSEALSSMGYTHDLVGTSRVDLSGGKEAVLSRMSSSSRRNLKRAQQQALAADWIQQPDQLSDFVVAIRRSYREYGLSSNSARHFRLLLRHLAPDHARILVVRQHDRIVAGSVLFLFGYTILESSPFVTPEAKSEHLVAGDLLKWEAFQYGIAHGYRLLDLNHIAVPEKPGEDIDESLRGINSYKLKWGGRVFYGVRSIWLNRTLKGLRTVKRTLWGG